MQLVNETWHIKAPVKYVYAYFTNIEYFKKDSIKYLKQTLKDQPSQRVSIRYHATAPFAVGNEIEIVGKQPLYKLVVIKNDPETALDFKIVPLTTPFSKWGTATLTCRLTGANNQTTVTTRLASDSTPNMLWRIFIKVIAVVLFWRTKSDMQRIVQKIEDSARDGINT